MKDTRIEIQLINVFEKHFLLSYAKRIYNNFIKLAGNSLNLRLERKLKAATITFFHTVFRNRNQDSRNCNKILSR